MVNLKSSDSDHEEMADSKGKKSLCILAISLLFYAIYILGLVSPQLWWGVHHLAFLPWPLQIGLPLTALTCILRFYFVPFPYLRLPGKSIYYIVVISVAMGFIYYSFPISESLYGDSQYFREHMGERTTELIPSHIVQIFSPNIFHPKIGNLTVLSTVRVVSYAFGLSHAEVYRILDMLCGVAFVALWLFFVLEYLENRSLKVVFAIAGMMAPFTQFFFGYEEIYAPAFPIVSAFLITLLFYFRTKKSYWVWLSALLFFLCLKIHFVFVFLFPSFILTVVYHIAQRKAWMKRLFSWRMVTLLIIGPAILGGAIAYFFILKDHVDPRFLTEDVDIYTRMFLPILSPPPPYDRYTLLHYYHIFDYFNMQFLLSGAFSFVLVILVLFYRKRIRWDKPEIIVIGLSVFFFALVYFMYNPLMSMPIDFDLFSLPGPVFCIFVVLLASQVEHLNISRYVAGPVIGLSLLCIPIFIVNAKKEALSYRMENLGKYIFKSYWIQSAGTIGAAIELLKDNKKLYEQRYSAAIEMLEPYALSGNDIEYGNLLWQFAKYFRTEVRDYEKALYYHKQAQTYDENMEANYIGLMEASYILRKYQDAYSYSVKLVEFGYPNDEQALRIAIQCAIYADLRTEAMKYCLSYLQKWPDNNFIIQIKNELDVGTDLKELGPYFAY